MTMLSLVVAFLALVVFPFGVRRWIPTFRALGDEVGYLHRGHSSELSPPTDFLRPPLLEILSSLCFRCSDDHEKALRSFVALFSALTVLLTMQAGWLLGGPKVALLAAMLLLCHPERIVLSNRIWPDPLMGCTLAACHLVLAWAPPFEVFLLGVLGWIAAAIRIDGILVAPLAGLSLVVLNRPPSLAGGLALALPTIALLLALSWRNHRRHGIPLPDDTVIFNLLLATTELQKESGRIRNDHVIATWTAWSSLDTRHRLELLKESTTRALGKPLRLAKAMAYRSLQLVGEDTFSRDLLVHRIPNWRDSKPLTLIIALLRFFTPLLFLLAFCASVLSSSTPSPTLLPALAVILPSVLFHFRTRYRVAFLPALVLFASHSIVSAVQPGNEFGTVQIVLAIGLVSVFVLLSRMKLPGEGLID